jgi:hypothetical protein
MFDYIRAKENQFFKKIFCQQCDLQRSHLILIVKLHNGVRFHEEINKIYGLLEATF